MDRTRKRWYIFWTAAALSLCVLLLPVPATSEDINLGATVPSRRPKTAATILRPENGQHFSKRRISVSGTCPDMAIVEIYKNSIFAGSTYCIYGKFVLQIDLVAGRNKLVAKVLDEVGQYGPNSEPVVVYYDTNANATGATSQLSQLIIATDAVYRGGKVGVDLPIMVKIYGGHAPYALSIDWGAGQSDLVSRSASGAFTQSHAYRQPGSYQIKIEAVDDVKQTAFVQTVAIVDKVAAETERTLADKISRHPFANIVLNLSGLVLLGGIAYWAGLKYAKRARQLTAKSKPKTSRNRTKPGKKT